MTIFASVRPARSTTIRCLDDMRQIQLRPSVSWSVMANLACTAQWKMRWTSKWLAYERTRSSECSAWRTIWSSQNTPKQLYWIGGGARGKHGPFFFYIRSAGGGSLEGLQTNC